MSGNQRTRVKDRERMTVARLQEMLAGKGHGEADAGTRSTELAKVAPARAAVVVPRGTFHISIRELKRQLREGKVQAGPSGIQVSSDSAAVPNGERQAPEPRSKGATVVPKGTFHWQSGTGLEPKDSPWISEFLEGAPNVQYAGTVNGAQVWTEWVTDPVTGVSVQLAYSTKNEGRTAEAWCIDPSMEGHSEGVHDCHCYGDGRLCTDLHHVNRTLAEKRARALLWVIGFCQYLKTGRFSVDEV